jgi:hypothetical protein
VILTRKDQEREANTSVSKLNLIKKVKGETKMNKPMFLRKFACIDSILRLKELENF